MTTHTDPATAAAYALGALDEGERSVFESHLATGCVACLAEVQSFRDVTALMAQAAPVVAAPPALRERVLAGARQVRPIGTARSSRRAFNGLPWLAAAASIAIAAWSGLSLRSERSRVSGLARDLAAARDDLAARDSMVAAFLGPEVHVVSLAESAQKPSARVYWNHTKNIFIVTAFNVPRAPEGKAYQLWAISKGKAPVSMGTFNTDASGRATLIVPVGDVVEDAGFIDDCAMTLEPLGGSPQPTERPRLVGTWRHVD